MHICHITSVHPRYDIRIFIKECQTIAKYGYNVSLVVADGLGDEMKDGVNFYDVGRVPNRILRILSTTHKIYAKVMRLKPNIVHLHDPELLPVGRKLRQLGFKVVYDMHEDVPKQVLNKHWIPKFIRPLVSKLVMREEKKCCMAFSGIVCATEIIAKRVQKYNRKTIALHNYPILAELSVQTDSWNDRDNSLLYIGSISESRGIKPLVASLSISHLKLELAGPYSQESLPQELSQVDGWNFVRYHGVLNREEIASLLQKVKIGVVTLLPTPSYVESLPIKLFEYMLSGIPVVASNFPLWEDIVTKYGCGILVDPTNINDIAKACVWLINNSDEAQEMGERGREAVLKHFSWEQEQHKLLAFYKSL